MHSPLPLSGIRVLDLSRLLPGPYLTMLLADLGAEVIKVETPLAGDYARMAPEGMGLDGLFAAVNRNKKSLAINFRNPQGRDILLKLASQADVFLEGFRPGAVARWKIDYTHVKAVNSNIVYCSLSGYGQDGPYRDRAGHDLNYVAVGGALGLNGTAGSGPVPPGVPVADLGGGMLAAISILSALIGRQQRGEGMYLDVALMDAVISWVTPLAGGPYFASRQEPQRGAMPLAGGLPCFNVYAAADGQFLSLAALEPHFWANFCQAVERPELLRRQFDVEIAPILREIFASRTRDEWMEIFDQVDACVEPVNSIQQMLAHPQVRHRGHVSIENDEPAGMASPFVFARSQSSPPPALGAHTAEVLLQAGFSLAQIAQWEERGIVKTCPDVE